MEKQIEDILKKHIRTQNSLIDEKGHNHWIDTINALSALLTSEVERERERLLKEVEDKVIGDEDYAGKEFRGKFGVEMMGEDEAEHRNYLKKEQRKALSDIGGGK